MWTHPSAGKARSRRETAVETPIPPQRSDPVEPASERGACAGNRVDIAEQLRHLESRLLAEAGGDPAAETAVRRLLDASCARFATARVRQFVPILVERDVRRRLRDEASPA
jgi:hypothetical protein